MVKRLIFLVLVLLAGFTAGLVVTGRMNHVTESFGRTVAEFQATQAPARPPTAAPAQAAPPPATSAAPITGGPDFTRVARAAVKGVANISSTQVVRTSNSPFANDPFYRYLAGEAPAAVERFSA